MIENRTRCVFTIPNGVPLRDQSSFDRLHHTTAAWSYTAAEENGGIEGIGGTRVPTADEMVDFVDRARYVLALAADAADLAIERAREAGVTWQQIGDVFGITRQAAQQRFGAK